MCKYLSMNSVKSLKSKSLAMFFFQVNHLPGSGFITLKVELATSKLKWIPKAFHIPDEKNALLKEAR